MYGGSLMEKWEYKNLWFGFYGLKGLKMSELENELNKLGNEGWRVICATEDEQGMRVLLERRKE